MWWGGWTRRGSSSLFKIKLVIIIYEYLICVEQTLAKICCFVHALVDKSIFRSIFEDLKLKIIVVVAQDYESEASNEYIVRGNSALIKCKVPSYVADLVDVIAWVDSEALEYRINQDYGN